MHWGSRATDPGVHPPEVLVVGAHLGFQMCAPMLLIEVLTHPGTLGLYAQTARPLIWVHTDPGFGSVRWGSGASDQGVRPPGVSVVGAQATGRGTHQPGFRCGLGLLIWWSQSRG